jgi:hypothetical protein
MWFTYLRLSAPAGDLDYDLAASVDPGRQPSSVDAGVGLSDLRPITTDGGGPTWWPIVMGALAAGVAFVVVRHFGAGRRQPVSPA